MAFTTLTMNRRGSQIVATRGPNHCGLADYINVTWNCEITILSESLDDRGFMIDQLEIVKEFSAVKETELSCERLSKYMAKRVFDKLLGSTDKENILRIACTISPMPEASMTFVWQKYATIVR